MVLRTYRVSLTGHITVDDTTVRSALLGVQWYAQPGDPPVTDEERFEVDQAFLGFTETLSPEQRLLAYLANVPLHELRPALVGGIGERLPGARVAVDRVTVVEEARGRRRGSAVDAGP